MVGRRRPPPVSQCFLQQGPPPFGSELASLPLPLSSRSRTCLSSVWHASLQARGRPVSLAEGRGRRELCIRFSARVLAESPCGPGVRGLQVSLSRTPHCTGPVLQALAGHSQP